MDPRALQALHEARAAEKRQALFYRRWAAEAAERGDEDGVDRLNGLHADEQHHLSRLSARLLELGEELASLEGAGGREGEGASYAEWERVARGREQEEIMRYEGLLTREMDATTRDLIVGILEVERLHESELGGKWTAA